MHFKDGDGTIYPGHNSYHEYEYKNSKLKIFKNPEIEFPTFLEWNLSSNSMVPTTNLSYFSVVSNTNLSYFSVVPTTNFSYFLVVPTTNFPPISVVPTTVDQLDEYTPQPNWWAAGGTTEK